MMCKAQRRCVGQGDEGWTMEQSPAWLCSVFLFFFHVLSPQNEAKGDPQPLPWKFFNLLE